jgi:TATA-box binding protein (TBP) (component of TFIID and TFIIIB)
MNDTKQYLVSLDECRNSYDEEDRPSWIKITTITLISKFCYPIDIPALQNKLKASGTFQVDAFFWELRNSRFNNQITIGYTDAYTNKSIKIFPNGNVQITGCSDMYDCRRILRQLAHILTTFLEKEYKVESSKVVMMNTISSHGYNLNLMEVVRIFSACPIMKDVSFEPDVYSAVKIKFHPRESMKLVTASIFSTGKIIINGAETLQEVLYTYKFINDTFRDYKKTVRVSKSTGTQITNIVNGYPVEELVKVYKEQNVKAWCL